MSDGASSAELRRALDSLLAFKPGVMITLYENQSPQKPNFERQLHLGHLKIEMLRDGLSNSVEGPWVCVDFEDGEQFAIWKYTAKVYRVGLDGAVEDEPIEFRAYDDPGPIR